MVEDPSHRHGYDRDSLMDWRKALPARPKGDPAGWAERYVALTGQAPDVFIASYPEIDPVGAEAFLVRLAELIQDEAL